MSLARHRQRGRLATALLAALLVALLSPAAGAGGLHAAGGSDWIVQLRSGAHLEAILAEARQRLGVRPTHVFEHALRGWSGRLTETQRRALLRDPRVAAVVADATVQRSAGTQSVPPGITRVGANPSAVRAVNGNDPTLDVDIAILDTGIGPHPDLRVAGGYNCTSADRNAWQDAESHGTHVGGIAAARDNSFGVVGVAPGARLWAVKIMDETGTGLLSWVICGLDWVAAQRDAGNASLPLIEVANMSIWAKGANDGNCGVTSAPTSYDLLHQAVCRVNREGITLVVSAANRSMDAANGVPGSFGETITVAAICDSDGAPGGNGAPCSRNNPDDAFGDFSNYGRVVDMVAPGVAIISTIPGDYGPITGTSMSAPHVAGGAALYYLREKALNRPRPTPEDVRAGLLAAGSMQWRTGTYPLGAALAPPLLDVSALNLPADFRIGATPPSRVGGAGQQVFFDVWLGRVGGFTGAVEIALSGLPAGATWSVSGQPSVPAGAGRWRRVVIQLPSSGASGLYEIAVTGSAAGMASRRTTVSLQFEGTYSVGNVPRLNFLAQAVPANTLPVVVRWPQVKGADLYELQLSRDGGAWSTLVTKSTVGYQTTAWPRGSHRFRVRARKNGQWGAWTTSWSYVATPLMAHDPPTVLTGEWTHTTLSKTFNAKIAYSTQPGARLRLDFTGRSVSWIATRGPGRGKAHVYIDGRRVATVDLYAAKVQHRQTIFSRSWKNPGAHRIVIEVLGTAGRPRVDVDAIAFIAAE